MAEKSNETYTPVRTILVSQPKPARSPYNNLEEKYGINIDFRSFIHVEGVEAKEAYTRTDIYDTLEEAPEGATEHTRMGVRYHELLAFIGAATEQRLTSIESRLTALEG